LFWVSSPGNCTEGDIVISHQQDLDVPWGVQGPGSSGTQTLFEVSHIYKDRHLVRDLTYVLLLIKYKKSDLKFPQKGHYYIIIADLQMM
jgi:hypothetical protein